MPSGRFRAAEWSVIGATIVIRLAAILLASQSAAPWLDPDDYLGRAHALAAGHVHWLRALADSGGLIVPPLYSAALCAGVRLALTPSALVIAQTLLAGCTCAAVLRLAAFVAPRRAALGAGWGFAVSPGWIGAAPAFWPEHLSVPIASAALVLLLTGLRARAPGRFAGAGALFAATALTRSLPVYVVPVLAAVLYVRVPDARRGVLLMLAIFAVLVGAYVTVASRAAGRFLLVENSPEWHWRARESVETAGAARFSSIAPAILRQARSSPILLAREGASHLRVVFSPTLWNGETATQFSPAVLRALTVADVALLAAIVLLAPIGLFLARDRTAALVLALWIAVQLPLIALSATTVGSRYRAPLEPALLALAAAALAGL